MIEGKRDAETAPSEFLVVPAVDVLGTEAVRLEQGNYARVSRRAGDPEKLVATFAGAGARLIHIVDLEGARAGRIRPDLVGRLCRAAGGVDVQASGGIRSVADATDLIDAGASRVVVGTAAFADRTAAARFAEALGDRLVVAIDARDGRVMVAGWTRPGGLTVEAAAELCAQAGVPRLHCTAVDRDGTLSGPDLDLLARVRRTSGLPVLAAGGIRSEDDLALLAQAGMEGAIVGRALLEGAIPLTALAPRSAA
jgi:phosphoribosylformimino-5-aminoimidazole carboxamide ribotide isomerase